MLYNAIQVVESSIFWIKVPQSGAFGPEWGIKAMFTGEYKHSMDGKGRLILPAKLRAELGDKAYFSRGLDSCLYVYTAEAWNAFADKLQKKSILEPRSRKVIEFFMSGADDCEIDKQGRLVVPSALRDVLGDGKDITTVGAGLYIEIWDTAKWKAHISEITEDIESLAEELSLMGTDLM